MVYDTAGHVFSQFESAKFRRDDDGDTAGEDVERCMACDLLILDDLGTEMTTAFVQSALYQLLNGRLLAGKEHHHQHQSGPGGVGPPLWSAAAVPSGGGVPAAALCGDGYPPPEA